MAGKTNTGKKTTPIQTGKEVKESNDPNIDQDFKNFPHSPSKKNNINPKTKEDKKNADIEHKDGEKMSNEEKSQVNEQDSDGSGGAFEETETTYNKHRNKNGKTVSDH